MTHHRAKVIHLQMCLSPFVKLYTKIVVFFQAVLPNEISGDIIELASSSLGLDIEKRQSNEGKQFPSICGCKTVFNFMNVSQLARLSRWRIQLKNHPKKLYYKRRVQIYLKYCPAKNYPHRGWSRTSNFLY